MKAFMSSTWNMLTAPADALIVEALANDAADESGALWEAKAIMAHADKGPVGMCEHIPLAYMARMRSRSLMVVNLSEAIKGVIPVLDALESEARNA